MPESNLAAIATALVEHPFYESPKFGKHDFDGVCCNHCEGEKSEQRKHFEHRPGCPVLAAQRLLDDK